MLAPVLFSANPTPMVSASISRRGKTFAIVHDDEADRRIIVQAGKDKHSTTSVHAAYDRELCSIGL